MTGVGRWATDDNTSERILREAAHLFAERGFRGTSVRQICDAAGTNVASVNYYYGTKENLYHEVFRFVFRDTSLPFQEIAERVGDDSSWRQAIEDWVRVFFELSLADEEPVCWIARLFGRERTEPSNVFPVLMREFFQPVVESLRSLLRMALPPDCSQADVMEWSTMIIAQVTLYVRRDPPWDELLLPPNVDRDEWVERLTRHVTESVTSRLSYRGPDPEARKSA